MRFETLRLLLSLVALHDWEIEALDAKTAFLFGKLDEEIYMEQPEGFVVKGKEKKVCWLRKAIYGLKQAALQWNKQLHKSLLEIVISMPDPPIQSALVPDPTPIYTEYLHQTSPQTYTVLHIGPLFSLPPSVPMLYLLLVSSLSIAYLRPFIVTMLSHMSPFVTIPPPYAFSILRPLPTCTSYLSTCFSILTSDPRSERHSI